MMKLVDFCVDKGWHVRISLPRTLQTWNCVISCSRGQIHDALKVILDSNPLKCTNSLCWQTDAGNKGLITGGMYTKTECGDLCHKQYTPKSTAINENGKQKGLYNNKIKIPMACRSEKKTC